MSDLSELESRATAELAACADEEALRKWNTKYFGKDGEVGSALKLVGSVPKDQRAAYGQNANRIKEALTQAHATRLATVREQALEHSLRTEKLDITLPGRPISRGRLHPSTRTLRLIYSIFADMGFQVYRSRDVEDDETNFGLLNMPPHHPARDMWDTFHTTTPGVLLRTHTSPGQIHVMREHAPEPIRVILPGMCYRYEQITSRSDIQFYQVEGLAVGRHITLSDLKGTLSSFARRMFGQNVRTRFRADHFPFTEPSAEMDVECFVCGGVGCPVCKHSGWLEILGCGMVHPKVLVNGGYDPEQFSGFAFGLGPQRIIMLKHRIEDVRYFLQNDMRFLEQFQ
jgi:phenylalanyl-tRNA synthetase alpha chain